MCLLRGAGGKTTDAAASPWQITDVAYAAFSPSSALTLFPSNVWGTAPARCHPNTNSAVKHLACEVFWLDCSLATCKWILFIDTCSLGGEARALVPGKLPLSLPFWVCHHPVFWSPFSAVVLVLLTLCSWVFSPLDTVLYVLWGKALSLAKFPIKFSLCVKLQAHWSFLAVLGFSH